MLDNYKNELFNLIENNKANELNNFLENHNKAEEKEDLINLLNSKNSDGDTPLFIATYKKNFEIVKALILAGANPNEYNLPSNFILDFFTSKLTNQIYQVENNPLWQASYDRNTEIVNYLIESGADKNLPRKPDNSPPFFAAAYKGYQDIIEIFIKSVIDINFRISQSETKRLRDTTMLSVAIGNKHGELAKYLIQQGAFAHYKTEQTTNLPLYNAVNAGQTDIVEELLDEGAGIGGTIPYLPRGVDFKDRIVIGLKINNESVNRNDYDSLQNAITSMDELQIAKKRQPPIPFIRHINVKDALGNTKLHRAILSEHHQILPILFECGIDVNATNQQGHTALRLLLDQEIFDPEIAIALIQHGADINTKNKRHDTLLHLLAADRPDMISRLSAFLPKENIENAFGETYLDIKPATELQNNIIVTNKITGGGSSFTKLSAKHSYALFFQNTTLEGEKGYSPLHKLLDQEKVDIKQAIGLIRQGYNVNTQSTEGNTLLHILYSSYLENVNFIFELLQLGADKTLKNNYGQTCEDIKYGQNKEHKAKQLKEEEILEEIEQQSVVFASIGNGSL